MCALPLQQLEDSPRASRSNPDFWTRLTGWETRYRRLWEATGEECPTLGTRTSGLGRHANFRHCRRFIHRLAHQIEDYPVDASRQARWRRQIERQIQEFGEARFGWPEGYRQLLVSEEFYDSTVGFVRQARKFNRQISGPDVGQALRNVWIVNSLQMLLSARVGLSPAIFAYSMLYPYTDNFLDDPGVADEDKWRLNRNLAWWLAGERAFPIGRHENDVHRLVVMVEERFDRRRHPSVFSSLQAIHAGQEESLRQHVGTGSGLTEDDILAISIRKGGASVLADGYLIRGHLEPSEEDFCMGYGVFLQLLDDLQDVQIDRLAGHRTLFTLAAASGPLDGITSRLYHFMHTVVQESDRFSAARYRAQRDLILRNCVFLLAGAVAENPKLFSRRFRRTVEIHWPLGLRSLRRLRRLGKSRFGKLGETLCHQRGVSSVFELL